MKPSSTLKLQQKQTNGKTPVAYWEGGSAEAQPLVMLHGLAGSHDGLLPLAQQMVDYRLFMPDMPGHGKSPVILHGVDNLIGWFIEFLDFVHKSTGQKPVVVAHSFGAQIALIACLKEPRLFTKCVVLNPVPHISLMPRLFQQSLAMVPRVVAHGLGANQHTQYWRNFYLLVRRDAASVERMQAVIHHGVNDPENFAFYIETSRQLLNSASRYDEIAQSGRFYCLVGDADRMINSKTINYLRTVFKEDHFAVCSNTGHLMPIEAPAETAQLVRGMLGVKLK